jgi:hypothetical protein
MNFASNPNCELGLRLAFAGLTRSAFACMSLTRAEAGTLQGQQDSQPRACRGPAREPTTNGGRPRFVAAAVTA